MPNWLRQATSSSHAGKAWPLLVTLLSFCLTYIVFFRNLLDDTDGSLRRLLSSDEIQCPKCSKLLPTSEIEDLLKYSVHQSAHAFAERHECACAELDPSMTKDQRREHAESVHLAHFNRCQLCEFFAEPKAMEKHFAREHKLTSYVMSC